MNNHAALSATIVFGSLAALLISNPINASDPIQDIRVIDGDTISINKQPIRLAYIDAPEMAQTCLDASRRSYACGEASAAALRAMMARDPNVTCEARDRDRYGRTVAECHNRDGDLGARLVAQGWAIAYRRYSMDYVDHEAAAKAERLGMHAGSFQNPSEYRKEYKR